MSVTKVETLSAPLKDGATMAKKQKFRDPMAVTWMEKYSDTMEKYWQFLPRSVGSFFATVAVFILGATARGEWIHIGVHFVKAFYGGDQLLKDGHSNNTMTMNASDISELPLLESWGLKGLAYYWLGATTVSCLGFYGIGGFLHWYYYVKRRHLAHEWKCQPDKWLSPELERHEIITGSISLFIGSTLSAVISCYLMNGGESYVYYNIADYGWTWWFLSWPVVFIYQDYLTYWHHRWYHHPLLYKHFHKLHHTYKQPTVFSVTAIHPVEFVHLQFVLISPMALFPVHWVVFVTILLYLYYHGIIDHSGINFKAQWWQPWQPDCIFHDNHHQYFHVNFGFNCFLWDKIHGTYRQKGKIYNEEIFFGTGKDISQCDENELKTDLEERMSENKLAYRGDRRDEQVAALAQCINKTN